MASCKRDIIPLLKHFAKALELCFFWIKSPICVFCWFINNCLTSMCVFSQRGPRDLLYGTDRPLPSDRLAPSYYHPADRGPPHDPIHHGDVYPPEEYLAPGHHHPPMEAGIPQGAYADPHGAPMMPSEHYPPPGHLQPQMAPPHGGESYGRH